MLEKTISSKSSLNDNNIVLVVDDAGLPTANPDGTGFQIPFNAYTSVLKLAETYNIVIPLAVSAAFIDTNDVAGEGLSGPYADELVSFLRTNINRLPVWNHGLTHQHNELRTEFFHYEEQLKVPKEMQRKRLELSQAIFRAENIPTPNVFVPPGHAWEPGVTDELAKKAGFDFMAIREFEKTPIATWLVHRRRYRKVWDHAPCVVPLYRLGLGISSNKSIPSNWNLHAARRYISPGNRFFQLVLHRRSHVRRPHHYFAHIQNFAHPKALEFWHPVIEYLLNIRSRSN